MSYLFKFLMFLGPCCIAQETLTFSYDSSGNQKSRELICVTCDLSAGRSMKPELIESKDFKGISYYPNPVLEQLFIQWENTTDLYVIKVEIYSMAGQHIITISDLHGLSSTIVDFKNMSQGVYAVLLTYNNEQTKDLKIVKK